MAPVVLSGKVSSAARRQVSAARQTGHSALHLKRSAFSLQFHPDIVFPVFFRRNAPLDRMSQCRSRSPLRHFVLSFNALSSLLFAILLVYKCTAQSTVTYNRGIGKVFTWGCNSHGQLYLGDGVTNATVDSHVPGVVTNLPKSSTTGAAILISGLAASTEFSLVLSGDGLLFSVGDNMKGQLGLGDHTSRKVLRCLLCLIGNDIMLCLSLNLKYNHNSIVSHYAFF